MKSEKTFKLTLITKSFGKSKFRTKNLTFQTISDKIHSPFPQFSPCIWQSYLNELANFEKNRIVFIFPNDYLQLNFYKTILKQPRVEIRVYTVINEDLSPAKCFCRNVGLEKFRTLLYLGDHKIRTFLI